VYIKGPNDQGALWYKESRVTRKFNKILPNIGKCGQNCSQNIKAQIEIPKHLFPNPFECLKSATNHALKMLI
jgi:hypothetical protein